MNKKTEHVTS